MFVFALSERLTHNILREGKKRLTPPPFAERGDTSPTLPPMPYHNIYAREGYVWNRSERG